MIDLRANGTDRFSAPDRRKFLNMLGGLGLMLAGPQIDNRQMSAEAQTEIDEQTWKVTLGEPDGPHPPFVSNSRRLLCAPELLDAPDEWINRSLQWIDYILRNYPPDVVELPVRRPALFRLDEVLHIESAPRKPIVQQFYQRRLQRAIAEIEQSKATEDTHIWRLYNHGALVRTSSASFAFDIVPGIPTPGFFLDQRWLTRLVGQSDALFISHKHPDHANAQVAQMFMAARKPVIAPERLFVEDPALSNYLTVPERSLDKVHDISIQNGKRVLKVVTYPGHQGPPVLNNVNLVIAPDGFTVVHTGDQSGDEDPGHDFDWLAHIGHSHRVDVLLSNGWTNDLHRIVRGVNPHVVIPGHQNEMTHEVSHREEYTQDYERMFGLHYPYIVMAWGENYLYRRPAEVIGELPDEN
jgi:L-ascorbate metabolism protein UlaG (beta-lactamase superfamily)